MEHAVLKQLEQMMLRHANTTDDSRGLFDHWREELGYEIGSLRVEPTSELSQRFNFDPEDVDIFTMHVRNITECQVHEGSTGTFMVLDGHGPKSCSGGILVAEYRDHQSDYTLESEHYKAGDIFQIRARKIHAFFPDPGGYLKLIGLVSPRIHKGAEIAKSNFENVRQITHTRVRLRAQ